MKTLLIILTVLISKGVYANEPFELQTPLTTNLQTILKLVRHNLNGWTRLNIDSGRTLWTPHRFYTEKISDPKKWVAQIKELEFCKPDKMWKNFPVLSVSNPQINEGFERVAANPSANYATALAYSETLVMGGKARTISYDYKQNGPAVHITCSAGNEMGDVNSIKQSFDIRNPQMFNVEQTQNGKALKI